LSIFFSTSSSTLSFSLSLLTSPSFFLYLLYLLIVSFSS
jgi:hypothetical protein